MCLRFRVVQTQLGPIDGASPCLRTGPPVNSDRIQSPRSYSYSDKK
jgi:hypothetical protein